jgi:hypothetical protein
MSALSIPREEDTLARLVEECWADLKDIPSLDVVRYVAAPLACRSFLTSQQNKYRRLSL